MSRGSIASMSPLMDRAIQTAGCMIKMVWFWVIKPIAMSRMWGGATPAGGFAAELEVIWTHRSVYVLDNSSKLYKWIIDDGEDCDPAASDSNAFRCRQDCRHRRMLALGGTTVILSKEASSAGEATLV